MIKRTAIAFTVFAAATSGSFAADLATPKSAKAVVPAKSQSWTGCYIGGNVGGALSNTEVTDETAPYSSLATLDSSAISGGGQIGCDYQLSDNSPWVIGIQGLYDATALSATVSPPSLEPLSLEGQIPWVATLTARAGYLASPDLMLYAKAGGAWTHTNSTISFAGSALQTANFDQNGWTAGLGAE